MNSPINMWKRLYGSNHGRNIAGPVMLTLAMILLLCLTGPPKAEFVLAPGQKLLVADIIDDTGRPDLGFEIKQIFHLALEQSAHFAIYPDAKARDALKPIFPDPDARITPALAQFLCLREGVPVFLLPHISRLHDSLILSVNLHGVKNKRTALGGAVRIDDEYEIAAAIEALGRQVREALGENPKSEPMSGSILPFRMAPESLALFANALMLQEKNSGGQLELLKQLVGVEPHCSAAQLQLASIYARLRKPEIAFEHILKAGESLDSLPPKQRYLAMGLSHSLRQQQEEAVKQFHSYAAMYPYDWYAHFKLGESERLAGNYTRALEELQIAIRLDNSHPEPYLSLCMARLDNQDIAGAREAWEHAFYLAPNDAEVIYSKGFLDVIENNLASAIWNFQQISKGASPDRSLGNFLIAQAQIYGGRFEAALATLASGIEEDKRDGDVISEAEKRLSRAQIYLLLGNFTAAVGECLRVPDSGKNLITISRLGSIHARSGQLNEARTFLRQLEEMVPDPFVRFHTDLLRGEIKLANHEPDQAVRSFIRAKEYGKTPLEPLARALIQAKQWKRAEEEYASICEHKALMLFPSNQPWFMGTWVQALFDAGRCAGELNKTSEARQYFRQYLWVLDGADPTLSSLREAKLLLNKSWRNGP